MKKYLLIFSILMFIPDIHASSSCNETILAENQTEQLPEGYCNVSLSLETNKINYSNGETIDIYNKLSNKSYNFRIEYWIEDENNDTIKKKVETTNTNKKQFTPKFEETKVIIIKNNLTYIDCININNKTYNELSVLVEVEKDPKPSFELQKVYLPRNKKIDINNSITATILAYTGNLNNLTVETYIENITNKTTTIYNQFNKSLFNVTLEIPYDCNIKTDYYLFTVEALGRQDIENLTIVNTCSDINSNITEQPFQDNNSSLGNETYEYENVINLETNPITGKLVYEATNEKAKRIATYLAIVVLAALTIIIISTSKNTEKALKETTEKWSSQLEQR